MDRLRASDERDLREVLRAEAGRHRPDRSAMWERIDQDRTRAATGPMSRFAELLPLAGMLRPAAAAAAVAAVLVAGVTGIRLANSPAEPGRQAAAQDVSATPSVAASTPPSLPAGSPTATASPTAPASPTSPAAGATATTPAERPRTPSHSARPSPAPTGGSEDPVRDGYLSATAVRNPHSITSWTQDDLTLGTTETITALDVTIKVAVTAGVADTGHWTSIPIEMVDTGVTRQGETLIYRFTLKAGFTLAPGSYTFAAQFNHATDPRPTTVDTYTAKTTATGGADIAGRFGK